MYKPIIRKFDKQKVYSPFIDNIWDTELADMQSISKFNKELRFLYWVINMYRKYRWVILLRDKKELQLIMVFKKN